MDDKGAFSVNTAKQYSRALPWMGWVILGLSALMSIIWSAQKLLEQDEIFSLQTDRVASFRQVIAIQKFYPISLEPPTYHLLAHTAMLVFGPTAFALRLPALAGYLLMEFCLFFFVRNLFKDPTLACRAGLFAMVIPALTWTFFYSTEGRPYGLLLGTYTAAALCWQIATLRKEREEARLWPLLGLAVALAVTLTAHFYGVLLLIPLCGAEVARIGFPSDKKTDSKSKRLDWGILAAIGLGVASLATTFPYVKASGEFKQHYYAGRVPFHMLTQPYRQMLLDYTGYPKLAQGILETILLTGALMVLWALFKQRHSLPATHLSRVAAGEFTLVALLVFMPVFAFLLGKFVTHALEARHSIGGIIGISVVLTVAGTPLLRQDRWFAVLSTTALLCILVVNGFHVRASAVERHEVLEGISVNPTTLSMISSIADRNIYFQNLGEWETASYYEPDTELRRRLVLVYSRAEEMQHEQHDTMYLTATHTMKFSNQPITSYDSLREVPGEHVFAVYPGSGWDWTSAAFSNEAAQVKEIGPGLGGTLVKVRFK